MPCNVHENLMSIIMKKHQALNRIRLARAEIELGSEIDANDIGNISKEIFDILNEADNKMRKLIDKVQDRIMELEDEYRKSAADGTEKEEEAK